MLRRLTTVASLPAVTTAAFTAQQRRFYTPPEDLKKLYDSNFDAQAYPLQISPSDDVLFAQFLFKACEAKGGNFDTVTKDFVTIGEAAKKLPVFWERNANVEAISEFKGVSPPMFFTLIWMQNNDMLSQWQSVKQVFEAYTNAQRKIAIATIYIGGSEKDHAAAVSQAKDVAKQLHASNDDIKGFKIEYQIVTDPLILSGFAVDVAGAFVSQAKGAEQQVAEEDFDYTNLPRHKPVPTKFGESAETEMMRKYVESMTKYDLEEQVNGV